MFLPPLGSRTPHVVLLGMVRGEEAKQKWVFKIKSKSDNKRLIAEKRQQAKKGGVLLDDIEMASYHK